MCVTKKKKFVSIWFLCEIDEWSRDFSAICKAPSLSPVKWNGFEKYEPFLKLVRFFPSRQTTHIFQGFAILIACKCYYKTVIFSTKLASIITNLLNVLCEAIVLERCEIMSNGSFISIFFNYIRFFSLRILHSTISHYKN